MAELLSDINSNDAPPLPLRLSLQWRAIWTYGGWFESEYQFGIFLGDQPLFNPAAYVRHAPIQDGLDEGYFHGESHDLSLFKQLDTALATNHLTEIEDSGEPWIKIAIGSDLLPYQYLKPIPEKPLEEALELCAIIQHGGPWHGAAMNIAGPAVFMAITRTALRKFRDDLFNEAVALCAKNGISEAALREVANPASLP